MICKSIVGMFYITLCLACGSCSMIGDSGQGFSPKAMTPLKQNRVCIQLGGRTSWVCTPE